jgi:PncC family amidohydrolase
MFLKMTPQSELVALLKKLDKKIATAESITGGLVAAGIVSVAGSSAVFEDGFVTYSDGAKARRLGVDEKLLAEKTAVSAEVCEAMVDGLFEKTCADFAVATTGYADGELGGKVFVGVGSRNGEILAREYFIEGNRNFVRKTVANCAICDILDIIKGAEN